MNKDLVFRDSPLDEVLVMLQTGVFHLAKHVKGLFKYDITHGGGGGVYKNVRKGGGGLMEK